MYFRIYFRKSLGLRNLHAGRTKTIMPPNTYYRYFLVNRVQEVEAAIRGIGSRLGRPGWS